MATKPATVPVWNTGGANNVAPSAGEKVTGWANASIPPSSYFNWQQKLYGEWLQYLSDGAFTGAATFASTVGVSGLLTASAGLAVTGTAAVTGAATVSTTLAVTGATTLTGGVAGDLTINTGEFKFPNRIRTYHPFLYGNLTNFAMVTTLPATASYLSASGAGTAYVPLTFDAGDRLKTLTIGAYGDGITTLTLDAYLVTGSGVPSSLGTDTSTPPNGSWIGTVLNFTDTTLVAGQAIFIRITTSSSGIRVGNMQVTYDHP